MMIVCLLALVSSAIACSCFPPSAEVAFCAADSGYQARSNRNNIHVYACGQVNDRYLTGAIEWSTVSQELRENLKEFQC
ncbi:hypothetical protein KIN20_018129 [Parelaphostrongylus tenuis]|uniref:Secreted protein n=1 Tax=Parelaphostrongylus tenuis TaxID=148309 RepID=A0AAD5QU61_PARTN|nr:hypothetical protein KIN20_018129 [Parelaphostrongylus tenuis]